MITDKEKLKTVVANLWFPVQHFESKDATEIEIELRERFESYRIWANKLIEEKI
jgi:predicted ATPase